jgi:histidyl-tRNA synthetase
MSFQAQKGASEYVPPRSAPFAQAREAFTESARRACYAEVETAVFEDTSLFVRGVGESSDVVRKEMYSFTDRGGRDITLRPEFTAGVLRAVLEHNLHRGALPVKVFTSGPAFRYERPQSGRYRQFYTALRRAGVRADMTFSSRGLKSAMKAADRSGARFAVIIGAEEKSAGTVRLKDLENGDQRDVAVTSAIDWLLDKLGLGQQA